MDEAKKDLGATQTTPTVPEPAAAPEKAGIKTTEFWICAILTLAGLLPASGIFPDTHVAVKVAGLIVSLGAALGYTVVRGSVKKAPYSAFLFAILLPLLAGGCAQSTQSGYIKVGNVENTMLSNMIRHDRMLKATADVNGDGKVDATDDADRKTFLRDSEMIRAVFSAAKGEKPATAP